MTSSDSLRVAHELFVSGHSGSSPLDIIITVLPIVPGSVIASSFTYGKKQGLWCFCIEYLLCVVPLILSFTILNQVTLELNGVLIFLLLIRMVVFQNFSVTYDEMRDVNKDRKLSCLTSSRATVSIATVIAILAVDFNVFPRRFAKTETFGYSLMDVGAACYLFMNGITDFKKNVLIRQTLRDVLILFILGLLRLISLRATDYQQHVTEYGLHCNFFFTLAAIKIFCVWWASKLSSKMRLILCIVLAVGYELVLQIGLGKWTFSELPRSNGILAANREWIVSMPGNALVYLLGMSSGELIFTYYSKNSKLFSWTGLPVVPFLALFFFNILHLEPSRRLSNVTFVVWIVGFFLLFLTLYKIMESIFGQTSCLIFRAVNSYPLLFFLLGNLLTGFVNLSVNTLETNNLAAFVIINMYAFILCYLVYLLNTKLNRS